MTVKELLPLIKAKGKGDRYSENLAKWVKKWATRRPMYPIEAAFLHWSNIDGSHVDMVEGKTQPQQILIGHMSEDGWFSGARLSCILGQGTRAEIYAFPTSFQKTPLPDWFQGYIDGGKCFIDPEHRYYGDIERWQVYQNGNARDCLWCGATQRRRVVERVVQDVYWDNLAL